MLLVVVLLLTDGIGEQPNIPLHAELAGAGGTRTCRGFEVGNVCDDVGLASRPSTSTCSEGTSLLIIIIAEIHAPDSQLPNLL